MNIRQRFWSKVQIGGLDECWNWKGSMFKSGYGSFSIKTELGQKNFRAHRVCYELIYGAFSNDLKVLHKCDNPKCVNPFHLFLGTQFDNIHDCISKGRLDQSGLSIGWTICGSRHHDSKLTESQVLEIRAKFIDKRGQLSRMAEVYKVSPACIHAIVNRASWKHV